MFKVLKSIPICSCSNNMKEEYYYIFVICKIWLIIEIQPNITQILPCKKL